MNNFIKTLLFTVSIALMVVMLTTNGRQMIVSHFGNLHQIDRTENVTNRIVNNSFFESSYAEIKATVFKIKSTSDEDEKRQLMFVLSDQISEYNARSRTITKGEWRAVDLPYQISIEDFIK